MLKIVLRVPGNGRPDDPVDLQILASNCSFDAKPDSRIGFSIPDTVDLECSTGRLRQAAAGLEKFQDRIPGAVWNILNGLKSHTGSGEMQSKIGNYDADLRSPTSRNQDRRPPAQANPCSDNRIPDC